MGSAFLAADLGLTPEVREDHAAYIATWLKALKDDKRLIFAAAAHAQRAANYLHGLQPAEVEEEPSFTNHYECPRCGHHWSDTWSCTCDDDCPACGCRHISPTESEDV